MRLSSFSASGPGSSSLAGFTARLDSAMLGSAVTLTAGGGIASKDEGSQLAVDPMHGVLVQYSMSCGLPHLLHRPHCTRLLKAFGDLMASEYLLSLWPRRAISWVRRVASRLSWMIGTLTCVSIGRGTMEGLARYASISNLEIRLAI